MGGGGELSQMLKAFPFCAYRLLCKPVVLNLTDRNNRNVQSYSVDLSVHCAELVECLSDSRNRSNSFPDHEPAGVPQYCEVSG